MNNSFDNDALRRAKQRLFLKRAPKYVVLSFLVLTVGYLVTQYLADLPRERFARGYKFLERVWLGAERVATMTTLKLAAHHEDLKNTELPVVEIYIKGKRLDRLKEELPNTDVSAEKAKFRVGDKNYEGTARFKGDSMNHWAFPNKSWRVELKDGEFYRGMQMFNLNVPRVDTQLSNWLGYHLAKDLGGLITPHAENVHFRLNRKFDGVRLLLEQPNQDMLVRRYLPPGKIFVGDISSEQIYGGVPRKRLYSDPTGWVVRAPGNDLRMVELEKLLSVVANDSDPYLFYNELRSIMDVDSLARYMALLELVGSVHIDETHNGKLYFHPHLGKFQPIVWDTVAYMWDDSFGLDLGVNRLFRVVLQNPALRELKDHYLWSAINENLSSKNIIEKIETESNKMRRDLYAFAFKLHANDKGVKHISNEDWEEALLNLKRVVVSREQRIREHLASGEVHYRIVKDGSDSALLIDVDTSAGYHFETLQLSLKPGTRGGAAPALVPYLTVSNAVRPAEGEGPAVKAEVLPTGELKYHVDDLLLSKRRFRKSKSAELVSGIYRYRLKGIPPEAISSLTLVGKNAITGEEVTAKDSTEISEDAGKKLFAAWWNPEKYTVGKQLVWSGNVQLLETLYLSPFDSLEVRPGTRITMAPNVSLFADGSKIAFNGTKESPIVVRAMDKNKHFGTIALRNIPQGVLQHVQISGGSYGLLKNVRYEGDLAVHGGEVTAENIVVEGNYISAKSGRLTLRSSTIRSTFPFAVKAQNAIVREIEVQHDQVKPVHHRSLLNAEAHGTPLRIEREYKFSVNATDGVERDLMDVAKEIRNGLERRVADRTVWNAPTFTSSDYYVDDTAEDFLFRDIYFDTPQSLAYKNQISYRYRNRYKSWKAYKEHIKKQDWPTLWPYRLEFQAKVGRQELGDGFSTVGEARFEFRDASKPFSPEHQPPDSPWEESEFLSYFESGDFQGLVTYPAQEIVRTLEGQYEGDTLEFLPKFVLVTERFRQHLNIPSDYGSGPNPEQSYIISLDKTRVYEAKRYLAYLKDEREGMKSARKPGSLGVLLEIEVEFERNVSDVLDKKIDAAENAAEKEHLEAVREAFLKDQSVIMQVVDEELKKVGLDVIPANSSKYVQAYDLAQLSR
ncbi:MAG: CotH kinase family protein [Bdellovibrionales bacterium]|nr:CotH kinase family protein [Bdellovibrionales bacterium]